MRIAYLECFSGISGDMFLGALVDAGVPVRVLEEAVSALGIGAELCVSRVDRCGISAMKVDVVVDGEVDRPRDAAVLDRADEQNLKTQSSRRKAAKDAESGEERSGTHSHKGSHRQDSHRHDAQHSRDAQRVDEGHERQPSEGHRHDHAHEQHEPGETYAHNHPHLHEHSPGWRTGASAHSMEDARDHDREHARGKSHEHAHGRHLSEIKRIIGAAMISERAKKTAIAIFEALGTAEAKIHNVDIERVHFHEVGAVDAIVDIVGAAVGAEALGVDEIVCSALNVGGGTVKCEHGVFPVPAPATVELLKGAPVYSSGVQAELVTPTGAAIVKTLATHFSERPTMKLEKNGYGAGTRDFAGYPNVVRLTVGEVLNKKQIQALDKRILASMDKPQGTETITVIEANLDDLNPQVFGYVMDRLLAEGALDAFGVPVQMKKNRPGTLLTVLCKPNDAAKLSAIVFAETTTLGVRHREEERQVLARRWENVSTPWGEVRMKIASMNGTVTNFAPEYEDCRKIAEERGLPLKSVMLEALQTYTLGRAEKKP
jgi:hypothetical protein